MKVLLLRSELGVSVDQVLLHRVFDQVIWQAIHTDVEANEEPDAIVIHNVQDINDPRFEIAIGTSAAVLCYESNAEVAKHQAFLQESLGVRLLLVSEYDLQTALPRFNVLTRSNITRYD